MPDLQAVSGMIARFYNERTFYARIVSVSWGGYMVEPDGEPGYTIGPCAYADSALQYDYSMQVPRLVKGFSVGDLVKCQRIGGAVIIEYVVKTAGAALL